MKTMGLYETVLRRGLFRRIHIDSLGSQKLASMLKGLVYCLGGRGLRVTGCECRFFVLGLQSPRSVSKTSAPTSSLMEWIDDSSVRHVLATATECLTPSVWPGTCPGDVVGLYEFC